MNGVTRAVWKFEVCSDELGMVFTRWSVWSDEGDGLETESDHGVTHGPLHAGIFAAYDALGITCPMVVDPDLLRWGGHVD